MSQAVIAAVSLSPSVNWYHSCIILYRVATMSHEKCHILPQSLTQKGHRHHHLSEDGQEEAAVCWTWCMGGQGVGVTVSVWTEQIHPPTALTRGSVCLPHDPHLEHQTTRSSTRSSCHGQQSRHVHGTATGRLSGLYSDNQTFVNQLITCN